MEFNEVYCSNCKKVLGQYNLKFYDDEKVKELVNMTHSSHVRKGHLVNVRRFVKD